MSLVVVVLKGVHKLCTTVNYVNLPGRATVS